MRREKITQNVRRIKPMARVNFVLSVRLLGSLPVFHMVDI
jgi:hypothetical protein